MSGYNKKDENKKIDSESESEHDESPHPDPTASGSNDPIFSINGGSNTEALDLLKTRYDALSLEDQLKVSKKMEQEFKNAKERMKKVASSKAVETEIKKAMPKATPVDRSKRVLITLNLRVRGTNRLDGTTITVNRHGKCGQIRHEICRLVGMKPNTKPTMEKRIEQMNVFIYTMGINDGDTIYLLPNVPEEVIAEMENEVNNAANADEGQEEQDDEQDEEQDEEDEGKEQDDADETAEQ